MKEETGSNLTSGQIEVLDELIGHKEARTYKQVAETLDISIGTVYAQLKRVRHKHPAIYKRAFAIRRTQLEKRNQEALARADSRSNQYFGNKRKHNYNMLKLAGMIRSYR